MAMKKLIGLLVLMLLMISATYNSPSVPQKKRTIEGTWELVSRHNYDGAEIIDTIPTSEGYRQIKMFYNGKVMWTRYVPADSIEWFGYGSYTTTEETLTEKLEYMSASMLKIANDAMLWEMELQLGDSTYTQIFIDEDGSRISSESYRRLD